MASAKDDLSDYPEAFLTWLRRFPQVPPDLAAATTFYQAVDAAASLPTRARPIAVMLWTVAALMSNADTRRYLDQVIQTEEDWYEWSTPLGRAVNDAMAALDRSNGTHPKREFERHRDAAAQALRKAHEHLSAVNCGLDLAPLAGAAGAPRFANTIAAFELRRQWDETQRMREAATQSQEAGDELVAVRTAMLRELARPTDDAVPAFVDLLLPAAEVVDGLEAPPTPRYRARALYLRAIFNAFARTAIADRRIALLTFVCHVVFDEAMDKKDVRELVGDLAEQEREFLRVFGDPEVLREDMLRQFDQARGEGDFADEE